MIAPRALWGISTLLMVLGGCGRSADTQAPTGEKADAIVTIDGLHHICVVALHSEEHGSTVPCSEVVPFLRDELRLAAGSSYDVRTGSEIDTAEVTRVEAGLKDAGYRLVGAPPP